MSASSSARGLLASQPPPVAIEIARDRVAVVSMSGSGGEHRVSAYAVEPVPAGVVQPALNAANVIEAAALGAVVKAALDKVAPRARRAALVLPDTVGKVSLLRFEKIPAKAQDLDQLIRWQVRKAAPFRIEDAQVSWTAGAALAGGGREFLVTTARRDVIESYEKVVDAAGVHAGLVDLASFNLVNAVLAAEEPGDGDWLLVHVADDYSTIAVVRGDDLVFFRNRAGAADADLADLVHQTAMYHEDRLGGGGFSRVTLAGASVLGPERAERLRRGVEERLATRVSPLDFRAAAGLSDRIGANPVLIDALAPATGILLRERLQGREAARRRAGRVA